MSCQKRIHHAPLVRLLAVAANEVERLIGQHLVVGAFVEVQRHAQRRAGRAHRFAQMRVVHVLHGHRRHAGLLEHLRKLHGVDASLVPAAAHLDRDGHRRGPHNRFRHAHGLLRVAHEGRAVAVGDNLPHWAAHVDVHDVRTADLRRKAGRLGHADRIAAENLDARGVLAGEELQQPPALAVLIAQRLRADHLRHGQPRPQLRADLPEREVGHAGHRGQHQL